MGVVGKSPNQRRRVSVESSTAVHTRTTSTTTPSPQQTAAYVAEICLELVVLAKAANLHFLAHLLTMAQAEAAHVAEGFD